MALHTPRGETSALVLLRLSRTSMSKFPPSPAGPRMQTTKEFLHSQTLMASSEGEKPISISGNILTSPHVLFADPTIRPYISHLLRFPRAPSC
jgi:hypothetical protein